MTNITKEISNILQSDLAIQKDLGRNVINIRALSRYILRKYELKASTDAAISAIRRFKMESQPDSPERMSSLFRGSTILTRNNVGCITLSHDAEKDLPSAKQLDGIGNPRIITGSAQIKIIIDQDHTKNATRHFSEKLIEKIEKDLSEISITIHEKATKTKGVLARIASEIWIAGINIEEIIIVPPEFLIYVKEEDLIKTHESLLRLGNS